MPQQTNYAADAGRIAELQRDVRSGALSARALLERCLARIDAVDPAVQALRYVARARASAAAVAPPVRVWRYGARDSESAKADLLDREAKAGRFRGPLHGIPVGIK